MSRRLSLSSFHVHSFRTRCSFVQRFLVSFFLISLFQRLYDPPQLLSVRFGLRNLGSFQRSDVVLPQMILVNRIEMGVGLWWDGWSVGWVGFVESSFVIGLFCFRFAEWTLYFSSEAECVGSGLIISEFGFRLWLNWGLFIRCEVVFAVIWAEFVDQSLRLLGCQLALFHKYEYYLIINNNKQ